MIFDENTIFDGIDKDLMNSLIYSTLLEIAVYIRTIKIPRPILDTRTESFYKDNNSINTTVEKEKPPRYY